MDGEKKFLLLFVCLAMLCLTILYGFLFISLWPYRQYVGASLLVLLVFVVVLWRVVEARGKLTEQGLRQVRYRHHEETPLDAQGEAQYWPQGAQANPYRSLPSSYPSYNPYGPYQTQRPKE